MFGRFIRLFLKSVCKNYLNPLKEKVTYTKVSIQTLKPQFIDMMAKGLGIRFGKARSILFK